MMRVRLVLAVLTLVMTGGVAVAGKSSSGVGGAHSSGGKGFSSGGSHSLGGKSYSSGGSHSGNSYSSGGSHPSTGATGSKPPSSSGRPASSFGGAGSHPSSGSSKGGVSYDSAAAAAARRAESRSSFKNPSGRDFGASSVKPKSGKSYSSPNYSSNAPLNPGTQPRSTYTDDRGRSRPLDPGDVRVGQIRNHMNSDWYYSRGTRSRNIFVNVSPYPGYPNVYYSDPYSNSFWWWMLGNPYSYGPSWGYPGFSLLDLWVYHHYSVMDRLRYQDLVQRNANLEAHLRALEQQGVVRDPTWSPPGVDPDLMYTDQYVDAALNPAPTTSAAPAAHSSHHLGRLFLEALIVMALFAAFVWLVFFKRWSGTNSPLGNRI